MKNIQLTQVFDCEQGQLRYGYCGDIQNKPPVILCHGTPTSALIWEHLVGELKNDYALYFIDLPGFGQSQKYEGQQVNLRTFAKVFKAWVLSLNLSKMPVLIGHDFGAATVLGAHLIEGLDVEKIIVADGVLLSPWGTTFSRQVKENSDIFASLPEYVFIAMVRAHLETATQRRLSEPLMQALLLPWRGEKGQQAYIRKIQQYDYEYTDILTRKYPDMQVPLTILWGECDKWVPLSFAQKLHEICSGSQMHILPDAGHFSMLDVPNEFARQVKRALSQNV